ncbi:hypothetical protein Tco_1201115 [Tanacetum coccineum]
MRSKYSRDDYLYYANHTAKLVRKQWMDIVDHDGKWAKAKEEQDAKEIWAVSFYLKQEAIEPLEWKAPENLFKPSMIKPPNLELKKPPKHLEELLRGALQILRELTHLSEHPTLMEDMRGALMEDEFKPTIQP